MGVCARGDSKPYRSVAKDDKTSCSCVCAHDATDTVPYELRRRCGWGGGGGGAAKSCVGERGGCRRGHAAEATDGRGGRPGSRSVTKTASAGLQHDAWCCSTTPGSGRAASGTATGRPRRPRGGAQRLRAGGVDTGCGRRAPPRARRAQSARTRPSARRSARGLARARAHARGELDRTRAGPRGAVLRRPRGVPVPRAPVNGRRARGAPRTAQTRRARGARGPARGGGTYPKAARGVGRPGAPHRAVQRESGEQPQRGLAGCGIRARAPPSGRARGWGRPGQLQSTQGEVRGGGALPGTPRGRRAACSSVLAPMVPNCRAVVVAVCPK